METPRDPDPRDDPVFRDSERTDAPDPAWEPPGGAPDGPQAPVSGPEGPQSPAGPQAPAGGQPWGAPGGAHQYGGPVPPGGWQQPLPQPGVPAGQLASWWTRFGAAVIDFLIIGVPALALMFVLGVGVAGTSDGNDAGFIAFVGALILTVLVFFVVGLIYAPLLMMRQGEHNGQTWGKQMVNIRVIRANGQPMNFGTAALREVVLKQLAVGIASSIIPVLPFLLNYFWPLWDDQNRALHDLAVDTRVISA